MTEQLSMFSDPLEETAIAFLRNAVSLYRLEGLFESYYGGLRKGFSFFFDPRTKCFYYSDDSFNTYKPQPWVRKKTIKQIRELMEE